MAKKLTDPVPEKEPEMIALYTDDPDAGGTPCIVGDEDRKKVTVYFRAVEEGTEKDADGWSTDVSEVAKAASKKALAAAKDAAKSKASDLAAELAALKAEIAAMKAAK